MSIRAASIGKGSGVDINTPILTGLPAGCACSPRASSSPAAEPAMKVLRSII
jgi:hypothetical protein